MINTSVTGETMIFRNDKGFYSTSLSKKKQDGTYDNAYINVYFKKGTDIPNKTKIDIKHGFLTFDKYQKNDEKQYVDWRIFILDYEVVGDNQKTQTITPQKDDVMFGNEDDLPF